MKSFDRLLGVLALLGLVLLFGPWLFDGDGARQFSGLSGISRLPAPEHSDAGTGTGTGADLDAAAVLLPVEDDDAAASASTAPIEDGLDATTRSRLADEFEAVANALDERPVDGMFDAPSERSVFGWSVQVGSFGAPENALRLRARLRQAGHDAWLDAGDDVTRVHVGPVIERADAEALARTLAERFEVDTLLVPFGTEVAEE